jgi:MFS family permease
MADRFIMIVALTPVKEAFNLSDAQAGLLTSLLTAGIAIIGIPAAVFGDRWARRKVISIMALTWSIFTFVTGIATQFWQMVVARFLVGSGEAGYAPVGTTWLSVVFPKEMRTRIMAVLYTLSQLGMVIGLVFGGLLISATHDWRTPFFVFAVPGMILAVIAFFLPDYKSVKGKEESMLSKKFFREWGQIFKIKSWWLVTLTATFTYFCVLAMATWTPAFLIRAYNMDTGQAGMAFGLIQLMVLLAPLGAVLMDRWHRHYKNARPLGLAIIGFLLAVTTLVQMLVIGIPVQFWLMFSALGTLLFATFIPILLAAVQDVVPVGLRSSSTGVFNFVAQLIGASLGPIIAGAISDAAGGGTHGLQAGILWMIPLSFLGVITALILLKFYPHESAGVTDLVEAEK